MRKLEIQAYTLDEAKINAFKQGITEYKMLPEAEKNLDLQF